MTPKRWIQVGIVFLITVFTLWAAAFIFRSSFITIEGSRYYSLFDDAMISMRYAWNFSHGLGLVWNPGEPVEGYTNLLMVGLMSIWTSVFDKPIAVLAVQLMGIPILIGIGILGLLHWLELVKGRDVRQGLGFGALVLLGCLLYYPLAYWTLMGMETGLLTLLLLIGSLLLLVYMRAGSWRVLLGASLALGLGYLTRPDSAPLSLLLICMAVIFRQGSFRSRLYAGILGLSIYSLFPLAQTAFRAAYYDSLVPLTYTLKMTGMAFDLRFENGLGFILPFIKQARWAYLLGGLGAFLGLRKRKAFLFIPPFVLILYQVFIGGDAWNYWRLVAPGIPYLILLTVGTMDWTVGAWNRNANRIKARLRDSLIVLSDSRLSRPARRPNLSIAIAIFGALLLAGGLLADSLRPGSAGFGFVQRYLVAGGIILIFGAAISRNRPVRHLVAFGVICGILISLNSRFLHEAILFRLPYQVENNRNHVNVSLSINRFTTEDASVGVIWAGIIPYYTSRYGIDFLGKNDPYIANLPADVTGRVGSVGMYSFPGHNKYDLEYSVLERRPTYVESFRFGSEDLSSAFEELYVEISLPGPDPAFLRGDPSVKWDEIPLELLLMP